MPGFVRFCVLAFALCLTACSTFTGVAADETFVRDAIRQVERDFVPDKRLAVWDVSTSVDDGRIVVQGKSDSEQAIESLKRSLAQRQASVEVEITLLPEESAEVGNLSWALVKVPVASLTGKPLFASPTTTQALLGTPLRVLEWQRPFWRVQMPDGYIGWVHSAQIKRLSQAQLSDWNAADHLVVTARTSELKDSAGAILMPLTVGSRLKMLDRKRGQVQAQLPDGRIGWIVAADVMDARAHASHWQVMRSGSREAFWKAYIAQAKRLLGTPYLWGGTSASGVDCSGFVSLMWQMVGIVSMRDADQLIAHANRLNLQSLDEIPVGGYLAFGRIDETGRPKVEHIGISLGKGDFIHSLGSVRIESVNPASECFNAYERSRFLGAYAVDLNVIKASLLVPMQKNRFYRTPPQPLQLR